MNRGEGLKRTTGLARVTPLLAKATLTARISLSRSTPLDPGPPLPRTGRRDGKDSPQQARRKAALAAWPQVRDLVLERDDWACVRCGRTDLRLEVHHRRHRSQGGADAPSNLVSLCGWGNHTGCHGFAHERANSDAAAVGLSVVWGSEPHEIAVLYPDGRRYRLDDDGDRVAA